MNIETEREIWGRNWKLASLLPLMVLLFLLIAQTGVAYSKASLETMAQGKLHPQLKQEIAWDPQRTVTVIIQMEDAEETPAMTAGFAAEIEGKKAVLGKFKDRVARMKPVAVEVENAGGWVKGKYALGNVVVAELPAEKVKDIAKSPSVKSVWPDRKVHALLDQSTVQINATDAWILGYNGSGVKIAILDTGINGSHDMLKGKVILEKAFTGEDHTMDYAGHGTHCAGIAAGTKEYGGQFNGVAPGALLLNGKVLDDSGSGQMSWVIAGINWAVDPDFNGSTDDGADVISMSLGATGCDLDAPIMSAVRDAVSAGVAVVAASGNCGPDCPSSKCYGYIGVTTPGCSPDVIGVGAVDKNSEWACFSSGDEIAGAGIKPDVVAPGVGICSSTSSPEIYACWSGTSMATPHVAGAAAILLQKNPGLSPRQVKSILEDTAIDLGDKGKDVKYGSGLINVLRAISPKIDVQPEFIKENVLEGEIVGRAVTVSNLGGGDLVISVTSSSWIKTSFSGENYLLEPTENVSFDIEINTGELGIGGFEGVINISSNIPDNETVAIPVTVGVHLYETDPPVINEITLPGFAFKGDVQILVNATDNEAVKQVTATIRSPGNETVLSCEQMSNDLWSTTYTAGHEGTHNVTVTAWDTSGWSTSAEANFTVVQYIFQAPDSVEIGRDAELLVSFRNVNEAISDVKVEYAIKKLGIVAHKESVGPKDIEPGSSADFGINWTAQELGRYAVRAEIFADDSLIGWFEKELTVTIPEVGKILGFAIDPLVAEKGRYVDYTVLFRNSGNFSVNATLELNFLDVSEITPQVIVSDTKVVEPNTSVEFAEHRPALLRAGNYTVMAKVHYGNRIASTTRNLTIYVPEIGVVSLYVPGEIPIGENANIEILFENKGNVSVLTEAESMILKNGTEIASFGPDAKPADAQSSVSFEWNWTADVPAGEYALKAVVDYEGNRITAGKNFTVIDGDPPEILNVTFGRTIIRGTHNLIRALLGDDSEIDFVSLTVQAPDHDQNSDMVLVLKDHENTAWSLTFINTTEAGTYNFSVNACDVYGNCVTSQEYQFTAAACAEPRILIVADDDGVAAGEDTDSAGTFSRALTDYCTSVWRKSDSGSPSLEYLQRFDAVAWTCGNWWGKSVDENDSGLLVNYVNNAGKVLLEGSEIGFEHKADEFMRNVTHSALYEDLVLFNETRMYLSGKHPVTKDLPSDLSYNSSMAHTPDAVVPVNNGMGLAEWNGSGSSLVIYNGIGESGTKTVYLPFTINALGGQSMQETLINNIVDWLLTDENHADLAAGEIRHGYLIEGENPVTVEIENEGPVDAADAKVDLFVDGILRDTMHAGVPSGYKINLSSDMVLNPGRHEIRVEVNSDFSVTESSYLNNAKAESVTVATKEADLVPVGVDVNAGSALVNISVMVKNQGGSGAADAKVEFWIDNELFTAKSIDMGFGESKTVSADWPVKTGLFGLTVKVNPDRLIAESDYSNNDIGSEIFVCDKPYTLIVSDSDTKSYSSSSPDGAGEFENILRNDGYCVSLWNESELGIPGIDYLNRFHIIIWSAGNHWNTVLDENDTALLGLYEGNVIFEGSDIAFDHNNDTFMQTHLHSVLDRDITLTNESEIILGGHEILESIPGINLDAFLGPYPDSLLPTNGLSIANWSNAASAMIVYSDPASRMAYFGFSIDAIDNQTIKERLILNTVEWIYLPGDVKADCKVDIFDLATVGYWYGTQKGDEFYNQRADVRVDRKIDIFDLATVGINYGKTC